MIFRYAVECKGCKGTAVLRIGVPVVDTDRFICACPHCRVAWRAALAVDWDGATMEVRSDDFDLLEDDNPLFDKSLPVITVYLELPVHSSHHTGDPRAGAFPFIHLMQLMGDGFLAYNEVVASLAQYRNELLPTFRNMISYAETKNWKRVRKSLSPLVGEEVLENDRQVVPAFFRVLTSAFVPLLDLKSLIPVSEELVGHLNRNLTTRKEDYSTLLEKFLVDRAYGQYRMKAMDVYIRALDRFQSLTPAIAFEYYTEENKRSIDEFRVFRDDFDTAKGLYVDIFEVLSQTLTYLSAVINLSIRGEEGLYAVGPIPWEKFHRSRTIDKLAILDETPSIKAFLSDVDRPLRNHIGHFAVRYDFRSGLVEFDDGSTLNYIKFLKQLLDAVRTLWFVLYFVEKIDLDMLALKGS